MIDNDRLYDRIDEDDSLSDQEKREAYRSEQQNEQDEQDSDWGR